MESHRLSWSLMESHRVLWNLIESYPVTIEVGVLSESASYYNKVSESDNKVKFF
jgi:hypothetical protein